MTSPPHKVSPGTVTDDRLQATKRALVVGTTKASLRRAPQLIVGVRSAIHDGGSLTPIRAIAYGGLTVGFLDGLDAIVFFGLRGVAPIRIFQAIASGLLGRISFQGGVSTAVLGILLHFIVAFVVVTVYYLASRRVAALTRQPLVCGPLYGIVVYLTMNLVVVPLSAAVSGPRPLAVVLNGLLIHVFGVGLPSALFVRAAQPPKTPTPSAPFAT